MRDILSKFKTKLALDGFFSAEFLCQNDIAGERFTSALKEARDYYHREKGRPLATALIHDCWKENISALESYFTGRMDEDFLSNETINGTMVFTDKRSHIIELDELTRQMDRANLNRIISTGLNRSFITGKSRRGALINSVHHLYHLKQFERATGRKMSSIKSVVEFGGGYGNMARIVQNAGAPLEAYSIIDLLLFSCIQYVFLCTTSGIEQVTFSNSPGNKRKLFTVYPMSLIDSMKELRGEMFLSTWALSESTAAAYDLVKKHDWFGASSLLLAYNEKWKPWGDGELASVLEDSGWRITIEPIDFLPPSNYVFATR